MDEKNQSRTPNGQNLSAAATELNNLLQIVSSTVAMLENTWADAPGSSERYFDMLRQSVERAAKVTAQLVQQVGGTDKKILMHPALQERIESRPPPPSPLRVSRCVLVVDDEPMALVLLQQILEQAGFAVVSAQSGFEAVDFFRKEPGRFALVLLDLAMPVMDGEETFNRLRAIDPKVVVLLNTGFIENLRLDRMMANGLAGFLRRPYRPDEVITQIESVLAKINKGGAGF